jgi:hypothetical protein
MWLSPRDVLHTQSQRQMVPFVNGNVYRRCVHSGGACWVGHRNRFSHPRDLRRLGGLVSEDISTAAEITAVHRLPPLMGFCGAGAPVRGRHFSITVYRGGWR